MTLARTAILTLTLLGLAAPATAQQRALTEDEIDLYAEMLAMGDVCSDVDPYRVRREELHSWMTERLARAPDVDLESVLTLRDQRQNEMRSRVARMAAMPAGYNRNGLTDSYNAVLTARCSSLSRHDVAEEFFIHG